MARLKLVFALFALMILTAGVAGAAYFYKKYVLPQKEVESVISSSKVPEQKPDLGKKHYDKAIAYIGEGELLSARNELRYMLEIYPESPTIPEAKRVLGEVNLDLIVSKIPMPKKSDYKVKPGDNWIAIARKYETTFDYIMRANAKTTTYIYKDEDLTVYKCDCIAEIDLDNLTLTVTEDGEFIKEYKILDTNLPNQFPNTATTTISEKVAWHNGRAIKFTDTNYMDSRKWIRTGRNGLFIRSYLREDELGEGESKPWGVMVTKADLEELFTILRTGSTVKVVSSKN